MVIEVPLYTFPVCSPSQSLSFVLPWLDSPVHVSGLGGASQMSEARSQLASDELSLVLEAVFSKAEVNNLSDSKHTCCSRYCIKPYAPRQRTARVAQHDLENASCWRAFGTVCRSCIVVLCVLCYRCQRGRYNLRCLNIIGGTNGGIFFFEDTIILLLLYCLLYCTSSQHL